MSAEGVRVWKVGEGELTNPPALSSPCSLHIDAKYVLISLNIITILKMVEGHYLVIVSIIIILFYFMNS